MIYLSLKTINEMPFSDSRSGIENSLLRSVTDCADGKVVFFCFFLFFFIFIFLKPYHFLFIGRLSNARY